MKTILKLFNIGLFIGAFIHILILFDNESTVTIKESVNRGIVPSILIFVFVLFLASFIYSNIKAKMAQEPFGYLSIGFYSLIATLFFVALIVWFSAVLKSAEQEYLEFVNTFEFYIKTLYTIGAYFVVSLGLSIYGLVKYRK